MQTENIATVPGLSHFDEFCSHNIGNIHFSFLLKSYF